MRTTSVPVSLSRSLVMLSRTPSYLLLLLLCNIEPTRALSIVHPSTLRIALIHRTHRDSRVSWLVLSVLVNARRGWGKPLMIAGLKRRHRRRGHTTRATASTTTNKITHCTRRLWSGGSGRSVKTVIRRLELRCDVRIRVFFFSGHATRSRSFLLRDML